MIRRCHHHICMSLVSAVTPARSRPTFAICGVPSQVWQRERRRRRRRRHVQFLSSSPSIFPFWPEDVQKTSVCIWSWPCGPAAEAHPTPPPAPVPLKDCRGPRGREASEGGYIKANANLFGHHQRVTKRLLLDLRVIHQQNPQKPEHYGYRNAEFFQVFSFRRSN